MTSSRQREIFKTWLFVTEDKVPRPGTSTFEEYSSNEDDPSHENSFKVIITGDIGDDEEIRPSDKDKVKSSEEKESGSENNTKVESNPQETGSKRLRARYSVCIQCRKELTSAKTPKRVVSIMPESS
jgi:hypothetical protein